MRFFLAVLLYAYTVMFLLLAVCHFPDYPFRSKKEAACKEPLRNIDVVIPAKPLACWLSKEFK